MGADHSDRRRDSFRLEAGQTVIFMGDHTSPDSPGYVRIIRDVTARFYPTLNLNLISAGARGQTANGLRTQALMDILLSSRPDWLVLNLGLGDAMREPDTGARYQDYTRRRAQADEGLESALGPEYRVDAAHLGPVSDVGREPEPQLERLAGFRSGMQEAVTAFQEAGIQPVLLTPIVLGSDLSNPINVTLHAYGRAVRDVAHATGAALVDVEQAFRDVIDRAVNYKQTVSLTYAEGNVNPQGEALIARKVLQTFGILPSPGFRPEK